MANFNEQKKYHYIYKTTNLKNGKFYVGMHSTNNINDGYLGSGKRLRRSINKYGKENFKMEILEYLSDRNSLKEREKELINEDLLKDPMCINMCNGGGGGFYNEEHREKFKIAAKQSCKISLKNGRDRMKWLRENDVEWYRKWNTNKGISLKGNKPFNGKTHTEETKQKMRKKASERIGNKNSQFGTCWITNGFESKKIKKIDLIPNGWQLGRKQNKIKHML